MVIDDEVFAVLLAMVIIASVIGIALSMPRSSEPFTAIGLLDRECRIGSYPKNIPVNQSIELCVFISNNLGEPALLQARFKVSYNGSIPTNSTPLDIPEAVNVTVFLPDGGNTTRVFSITITRPGYNIVIAGELWVMDFDKGSWAYTGRHVFIRVNASTILS